MGRHTSNRTSKVLGAAALAAVASVATSVHAAVVYDGSAGRAGKLTGPNYPIAANRGRLRGGNLLPSFSQLDLAKGETATSQAPTKLAGPSNRADPPPVTRVFARVTGGTSTIDGTLRVESE